MRTSLFICLLLFRLCVSGRIGRFTFLQRELLQEGETLGDKASQAELLERAERGFIARLDYSNDNLVQTHAPTGSASKVSALLAQFPSNNASHPLDGSFYLQLRVKQKETERFSNDTSDYFLGGKSEADMQKHVTAASCVDSAVYGEALEFEISPYAIEDGSLSRIETLNTECIDRSYKKANHWQQNSHGGWGSNEIATETTTAENCFDNNAFSQEHYRYAQASFTPVPTQVVLENVTESSCSPRADERIVSFVPYNESITFHEEFVREEECLDSADAVSPLYAYNTENRWDTDRRSDALEVENATVVALSSGQQNQLPYYTNGKVVSAGNVEPLYNNPLQGLSRYYNMEKQWSSREPAFTLMAWVKGHGTLLSILSGTSVCGKQAVFSVDAMGKPSLDFACMDQHDSRLHTVTSEWRHVAFTYDGHGTRTIVIDGEEELDVYYNTSRDYFKETDKALVNPHTHNTVIVLKDDFGNPRGRFAGFSERECLEASLAMDHAYFALEEGLCNSSASVSTGTTEVFHRSVQYRIQQDDFLRMELGPFVGEVDELLFFAERLPKERIHRLGLTQNTGTRFNASATLYETDKQFLYGETVGGFVTWQHMHSEDIFSMPTLVTKVNYFVEQSFGTSGLIDYHHSACQAYATTRGYSYTLATCYTCTIGCTRTGQTVTYNPSGGVSSGKSCNETTKCVVYDNTKTPSNATVYRNWCFAACSGSTSFSFNTANAECRCNNKFNYSLVGATNWVSESYPKPSSFISHPMLGLGASKKVSWEQYPNFYEEQVGRAECRASGDHRYETDIGHHAYVHSAEGRGGSSVISYEAYSKGLENITHLAGGSYHCQDDLLLDSGVVLHSYQNNTSMNECRAQRSKDGACLLNGEAVESSESDCTGVFLPFTNYTWLPDPYTIEYDTMESDCPQTSEHWGYSEPLLLGAQGRNTHVFNDHERDFYHLNKVGGPRQTLNMSSLASVQEWCRATISCAGIQQDGDQYYPVEEITGPSEDYGYRLCLDENAHRIGALQCFVEAAKELQGGVVYIHGDEFRLHPWGYSGSANGTSCTKSNTSFFWGDGAYGDEVCSDKAQDYYSLPIVQTRWQRDNDTVLSTKEKDCVAQRLQWLPHAREYDTIGTGSRPHFLVSGQKAWQREPVDCLYASNATFAINKTTVRECRDEAIFFGAIGYSFQGVGAEFIHMTARHYTHPEEARAECQRLQAHSDGPENAWDLCTNDEWDCASDNSCLTSDTPDNTIFAVAACCFNTGTSCAITTNTSVCTPKRGYESFSFRACADEKIENATNTTYNVYAPEWNRSEWRAETHARAYNAAYYDIVQESEPCDRGMHLSYDECQTSHSDAPILHAEGFQCSQSTLIGLFVSYNTYTFALASGHPIQVTRDECWNWFSTVYCSSPPCTTGPFTRTNWQGQTSTYYIKNYFDDNGLSANTLGYCGWFSSSGDNRYFKIQTSGTCHQTYTGCLQKTTIPHTKFMKVYTDGTGVVVPDEACQAFASALSVTYSTENSGASPQGCYVIGSTGNVVYNNNANTVQCSSSHNCVKLDSRTTSTADTYREWCANDCSNSLSFSLNPSNAQCQCSTRVDQCLLQSAVGFSLYRYAPAWIGEIYDKGRIAGCAVKEGAEMFYNQYRYDSATAPNGTLDIAFCKRTFEHFTSTFDYSNTACMYLNHELELSISSQSACQDYGSAHGFKAISYSDQRCLLARARGPCEAKALWSSSFFVEAEVKGQFTRNTNLETSVMSISECLLNQTALFDFKQISYGREEHGLQYSPQGQSHADLESAKLACDSDTNCTVVYATPAGDFYALGEAMAQELPPTHAQYTLHKHWVKNTNNYANRTHARHFHATSKEACHEACLADTNCMQVVFTKGYCFFYDDIYEVSDSGALDSHTLHLELKGAVAYGDTGDCWLYGNSIGRGKCTDFTNASNYSVYPLDESLTGENKVVYVREEADTLQATTYAPIVTEERTQEWCQNREGSTAWQKYTDIVYKSTTEECTEGTWVKDADLTRSMVLERECELLDSHATFTRNPDIVTETNNGGLSYQKQYDNGYRKLLGLGCGSEGEGIEYEYESGILYGQECYSTIQTNGTCQSKDKGYGYALSGGLCLVYDYSIGSNASDCRYAHTMPNNQSSGTYRPISHLNLAEAIDACNTKTECVGVCEGEKVYYISRNRGTEASYQCHRGWSGDSCAIVKAKPYADERITDKRHTAIAYCQMLGQELCKAEDVPLGYGCVHYKEQSNCTVVDHTNIHAVAFCCGKEVYSGKAKKQALFYNRTTVLGTCQEAPIERMGSAVFDHRPKLLDSYIVDKIATSLCHGGSQANTGDCEQACLNSSSCLFFTNRSTETDCWLHTECTSLIAFGGNFSTYRLRRKQGVYDAPQAQHAMLGDCQYHYGVQALVEEELEYAEATQTLYQRWRCERASVSMLQNLTYSIHSFNESFQFDIMEEHTVDDERRIHEHLKAFNYSSTSADSLQECLAQAEMDQVVSFKYDTKECLFFEDSWETIKTASQYTGASRESYGLYEGPFHTTLYEATPIASYAPLVAVSSWLESTAKDDCEVLCEANELCEAYALAGQECQLHAMPNQTMVDYLRAVEGSGSILLFLRSSGEYVCRRGAVAWDLVLVPSAVQHPIGNTEALSTSASLGACKQAFLNDERVPRLDTVLYNASTGECRISLLRNRLLEASNTSANGFSHYTVSKQNPYRTEATKYDTEDIARDTCMTYDSLLVGRDSTSWASAVFWEREQDVIRHEMLEEHCGVVLPPQLPLLSYAWDQNQQGSLAFNIKEAECKQSDQFLSWRTNIAGQKKIEVQNETECLAYSTNETSALYLGREPIEGADYRSSCNGIVAEHNFERLFTEPLRMLASEDKRILVSEPSIDACAATALEYYSHFNRSASSKVFEYHFTKTGQNCAYFESEECLGLCLVEDNPSAARVGFSSFRLDDSLGIGAAACWLLSVMDSTEGNAYCRKCPIGKHNSRAASNCLPCQQGRYSDEEGLKACKSCNEGTFQFGSGETHCNMCAAGQYQDEMGERGCKICAAGKYEEAGVCKDCPIGKAGPNNYLENKAGELQYTGSSYKGALVYFDPRYDYSGVHGISYKDEQGVYMKGYSPIFTSLRSRQAALHDSSSDCLSCEAGKYGDEQGLEECKACAHGTYTDQNGQIECKACGIGEVTRTHKYSFHSFMPYACSSAETLGEFRDGNEPYERTMEDTGILAESVETHLDDCLEACKSHTQCLYLSYSDTTQQCRLFRKCDEIDRQSNWHSYRKASAVSSGKDSIGYTLAMTATAFAPSHHICEEAPMHIQPDLDTYVKKSNTGITSEGTIALAFRVDDAVERCNALPECVGFVYAGAEDATLRTFSEDSPIYLKSQGNFYPYAGLQAFFKEEPTQTKKGCQEQCALTTGCNYMSWNTTVACRKWTQCTPVKKPFAFLDTATESNLYKIERAASFTLFPFQGRWPCDAIVHSGMTVITCEQAAVGVDAPLFYFEPTGICHVYPQYENNGVETIFSGQATPRSSICLSGGGPVGFDFSATGRLRVIGRRRWEVGASQCTSCPAGLKTAVGAGASICRQCAVGQYDRIPDSCTSCEKGRYQNEAGQANCKACSAGRYNEKIGQSTCLASGQGYRTTGTGFTQTPLLQYTSSGPFQNNTYNELVKPEHEGATAREICPRNSFAGGFENTVCLAVPLGSISVTRSSIWQEEAEACLYDSTMANTYANLSTSDVFYEGDMFNRMGLPTLQACIDYVNEQADGHLSFVFAISFGGGYCHLYSETSTATRPDCVATEDYASVYLEIGEASYASDDEEPAVPMEWFYEWTPHDGIRFVSTYNCSGLYYHYVADYYSATECVNLCRLQGVLGMPACRYISYSETDQKCWFVNWRPDNVIINSEGAGEEATPQIIFENTLANIELPCSFGSRSIPHSNQEGIGSGGYRIEDHVPMAGIGSYTEHEIADDDSFGNTMRIEGRLSVNGFQTIGNGGTGAVFAGEEEFDISRDGGVSFIELGQLRKITEISIRVGNGIHATKRQYQFALPDSDLSSSFYVYDSPSNSYLRYYRWHGDGDASQSTGTYENLRYEALFWPSEIKINGQTHSIHFGTQHKELHPYAQIKHTHPNNRNNANGSPWNTFKIDLSNNPLFAYELEIEVTQWEVVYLVCEPYPAFGVTGAAVGKCRAKCANSGANCNGLSAATKKNRQGSTIHSDFEGFIEPDEFMSDCNNCVSPDYGVFQFESMTMTELSMLTFYPKLYTGCSDLDQFSDVGNQNKGCPLHKRYDVEYDEKKQESQWTKQLPREAAIMFKYEASDSSSTVVEGSEWNIEECDSILKQTRLGVEWEVVQTYQGTNVEGAEIDGYSCNSCGEQYEDYSVDDASDCEFICAHDYNYLQVRIIINNPIKCRCAKQVFEAGPFGDGHNTGSEGFVFDLKGNNYATDEEKIRRKVISETFNFRAECRWIRKQYYDRLTTALLQDHTLASNVFPNYKELTGYSGQNILNILGFYDIWDLNGITPASLHNDSYYLEKRNNRPSNKFSFVYKQKNHIKWNKSAPALLFDVGTNSDEHFSLDRSRATARAVRGGNSYDFCEGSSTSLRAMNAPISCTELGFPFAADNTVSVSASYKICTKIAAASDPITRTNVQCCIGTDCPASYTSCSLYTTESGLELWSYTPASYSVSGDQLAVYTSLSEADGMAHVKDRCNELGDLCMAVSGNVADELYYAHGYTATLAILDTGVNSTAEMKYPFFSMDQQGAQMTARLEDADNLLDCAQSCLLQKHCLLFTFNISNNACKIQTTLGSVRLAAGADTSIYKLRSDPPDDTSKAQLCFGCEIGSSASNAIQGGIGSCAKCSSGSISYTSDLYVSELTKGLPAQEQCRICPEGTYHVAVTASCHACERGFACPHSGSYLGNGMKQCSPNEYSTSSLLDFVGEDVSSTASLRCASCSAGKYNVDQSMELCLKCPKGFFSNSGGNCLPCTRGTYSIMSGSDECIEVDTESYTAWPASTLSEKRSCAKTGCTGIEERVCLQQDDAQCEECRNIKPGHRTYSSGSECVTEKCEAGTYSPTGCIGRLCCTKCFSLCVAGQRSSGCGHPTDDQGGNTQNTQCVDCEVNSFTQYDAASNPCPVHGVSSVVHFGDSGICSSYKEPHQLNKFMELQRLHEGIYYAVGSGNDKNEGYETGGANVCCSAAAYQCVPCRSLPDTGDRGYSTDYGRTFGKKNQPPWTTKGETKQKGCVHWYTEWGLKAAEERHAFVAIKKEEEQKANAARTKREETAKRNERCGDQRGMRNEFAASSCGGSGNGT